MLRRRLAVLLAAIAVPAMAAPGDFGALAGNAAPDHVGSTAVAMGAERLPFETPGNSFPGSAFYFLADPPAEALIALPSSNPLEAVSASEPLGALLDAGPAASPFSARMSGTNLSRAMQCMTQAIYFEAASESDAGQRAVAQVVLNRLAHPSWPNSVCGVVYQGSQRTTGCQFTFTCDGSLSRTPSQSGWSRARQVASQALAGEVFEPIGLATHYHTHWVNPYWAKSLDHIGTIGAHRFYRTPGVNGTKSAFAMRHGGRELDVSRISARRAAQPAAAKPASPPAGNAPRHQSRPQASASRSESSPEISTPIDPAMQSVGQVRQDYSNAGQWKAGAAGMLGDQGAVRRR